MIALSYPCTDLFSDSVKLIVCICLMIVLSYPCMYLFSDSGILSVNAFVYR